MKSTAFQNKGISFYVEDNGYIKKEFLDDINMLIGGGEIPNLLSRDELYEAYTILKEEQNNTTGLKHLLTREYFYHKVQTNLHIIMGFSPIGTHLRQYFRVYRNFINHTTIKWIHQWPSEALL